MPPFEESLVQVMDMMFDISSLFDFLVTIVVYVFYALGLSRMAKACHHPRPWMAWVPYADYYLTGELAELSAIRHKKKMRPYAAWMLTMQIILTVVGFAFCIFLVGALSGFTDYLGQVASNGAGITKIPASLWIFLPFALVTLALGIVNLILRYHALQLVFRLFDEKNALAYTVLCILFTYAQPIILMVLSTKKPYLPDPEPAPEVQEALSETTSE
jgi:hypothetical protein